MTYTIREHVNEYTDADLAKCVKRFISLLDVKEESDSGRVFNPTTISSCRTLHLMELNDILSRMRELVNEV